MKQILFLLTGLLPTVIFAQQQDTTHWTLVECINYAHKNNIQVQSAQVSGKSAGIDLLQAKAQKLPSLNFSSSQTVANQKTESPEGEFKSQSAYNGNYSLNLSLTLYSGSKLKNSIRYQEILAKSKNLDTEVATDNIEIAVTEAYLQILYANESLKTNRQTVETSQAQMQRAKALLEAGSISASDYAQLEAQYNNDRYQLTVSENTLAQSLLTLKQLLELDLNTSFNVIFPELDNSMVLTLIPALPDVYHKALEVMPVIASSRLGVDAAEYAEKKALSERLPSVSFNAGINTGNFSNSGYSFFTQLNHRLTESAGINISIPILNNRQGKSSIEKAKLQKESACLDYTGAQKDLLKTVESLYLDATSAQSKYMAATSKLQSAELSYNLVREQFDAGMKNTVELLTEKNNFLTAQQEQIQAKYQTILSVKLLNFYQNEPITL